jgi:pimeloyl-ACP methyl ester carboxylesterase
MRSHTGVLLFLSILGTGLMSAQSPSQTNGPGNFVDVDGSKVYYEECGNGPKVVVLLHDGVVNSAVWDDVWPAFCKQFHAIRYDLRGYGRSTETKKPYYEADDIAAILHDRKISHAALVASSHGGEVALTFALRYPAQVSDLVLVGPETEGFPYSEHFLMNQVAYQNAKDKTEALVQSPYLIAPGHEAAHEHLRSLLKAAPQDQTHNASAFFP